VGADRGLKLLALRRLDELPLGSLDGVTGPTADGSTTLRDALSLLLTERARTLVVTDGDGRPRGTVTLDGLAELEPEP
jgi:CBS domain-containing protein